MTDERTLLTLFEKWRCPTNQASKPDLADHVVFGDALRLRWTIATCKYGTAKTVKPGTVILHSRVDDVVPFADSEELARNSGLPATALIEVGRDHRLADPESLAAMLRECEGR